MFDDPSTIVSSELDSANNQIIIPPEKGPNFSRKFLLIVIFSVVGIAAIIGIIFLFLKSYNSSGQNPPINEKIENPSSDFPETTILPVLDQAADIPVVDNVSFLTDEGVEHLSFTDFYELPDNDIEVKINDYDLPINVKIDVMNYYDTSRKLNLDLALDDLNQNGFALIDNPWPTEEKDFSSIYAKLNEKQIPILITSDFLVYYYQNILKKTFKNIEENVFYDNLWEINKKLYLIARNRYEGHLAAVGNINDSVLEGERLETAFFAVALELLKPTPEQLANKNVVNGQFTSADADRFSFSVPSYLREDVLAEVALIKEAKKNNAKSPVFLYSRNYPEFVVPTEYKMNDKLSNFYLTTKWLNSVFPLNYRDEKCPDCLLDKQDWRINFIAASLISSDFSSRPELKNKWARIYKMMFFFKGLREDLNYIHYRDSLTDLFGSEYEISKLFDEKNKDSSANLEKLRVRLLTYDFSKISGEIEEDETRVGFKMLAESYWPNNYIFSQLTYPVVGDYLGTSTQSNNITSCRTKDAVSRCNGFSLDIVNLVSPINNNDYFAENSNYSGYEKEIIRVRKELADESIQHSSNYWKTLEVIKAILEVDKDQQPLFAKSLAWRDKSLRTSAAAWINLQLPLENFSVISSSESRGLDNFSRWDENSYVEPNLKLINEILASNEMLMKMFSALALDLEARVALQEMRSFSDSLESLKKIVIKELNSEELEAADNEMIVNFAKQIKMASTVAGEKSIALNLSKQKTSLKEDLSRFKLLVVTHQEGDNKVFSVGPVWDYKESR
ncbi:MAG: DUF3160 domain-containing protein [Patescibacteria group bacterium]